MLRPLRRRNLKTRQMFFVHTTPKEFQNGVFTLKTRQMFSVHTTPNEFKNATITGHFGFVFEENSVREITRLSWCHCFRKALFSKYFPPTLKWKAGVFKFLRFAERFRKAPFSCRISVDGRPNRRNKAALSNSSGVVWTLPLRMYQKNHAKSRFCRNATRGDQNALPSNQNALRSDGASLWGNRQNTKGKLSLAFFSVIFEIQDVQDHWVSGNLFFVHDDNLCREC